MAPKLNKKIKRELALEGALYTVTISPDGVSIAPKGRRKGRSITWEALLSGDAELRQALKMSLDAFGTET